MENMEVMQEAVEVMVNDCGLTRREILEVIALMVAGIVIWESGKLILKRGKSLCGKFSNREVRERKNLFAKIKRNAKTVEVVDEDEE